MQEAYDPGPEYNIPVEPFISLEMQTGDIFSCLGYLIVSEVDQNASALQVDIHGVAEPGGFCAAALGPAVNRFPLDLESGRYDLNFHYDDTHRFSLVVSDSSLEVSGDESSFVSSETDVYWRYPEQPFACLCKSTSDTQWMCEEFEQMLNDSLDIDSFTFPDYGTIPYPTTEIHDIAIYYKYPDETVYTKAGNMLDAYADSVVSTREGAYLMVINRKNKAYWSWFDYE